MTQIAVDNAKLHFQNRDFQSVRYLPRKNTIICDVNETVSIVLKKRNGKITVQIRNLSKYVSLTEELFKFICDCNVSISFLISMLEHESVSC